MARRYKVFKKLCRIWYRICDLFLRLKFKLIIKQITFQIHKKNFNLKWAGYKIKEIIDLLHLIIERKYDFNWIKYEINKFKKLR